MAEEISSDPESKTLGDGGLGATPQLAKSSDGVDGTAVGAGDGGEERWKRERWTRNESMALVSAMKQLEEDASTTSAGGDAKWKSISQICSNHGVQRTSVQCRKRWNTLLAAYRKIKDWEKKNGMESYWAMGGLDCKAKKLPAGFDEEIWNVMNSFLAGRSGFSPRLFPYKMEDAPPVDGVSAGTLPIDATPAVQPVSQPPLSQASPQALPETLAQPLPQTLTETLQAALSQSSVDPLPQTLPEGLAQPMAQVLTQSVSQGLPPSANLRARKDTPRKRKRAGRQEIPVVAALEVPKQAKVDEKDAGPQRQGGFETLDPLTHFLSSFLEKSLEAYERNSELNRRLKREQGEKLVAVLGSLSSAVRDLVQQK